MHNNLRPCFHPIVSLVTHENTHTPNRKRWNIRFVGSLTLCNLSRLGLVVVEYRNTQTQIHTDMKKQGGTKGTPPEPSELQWGTLSIAAEQIEVLLFEWQKLVGWSHTWWDSLAASQLVTVKLPNNRWSGLTSDEVASSCETASQQVRRPHNKWGSLTTLRHLHNWCWCCSLTTDEVTWKL